MLTRLAITNLATIESLAIEWDEGFTVLTGETGAGKSILIDAILFVLGAKTGKEQIRSGADQTSVEAVFQIGELPLVRNTLEELEIPADGELVLRRTLHATGRGRALANDCAITQARLEALGAILVNVHGQHDNQLLLDPDKHLDFLDTFGGLEPLREEVGSLHGKYTHLLRERRELQQRAEQREQRARELAEQTDTLREAALAPGEEEGLRRELARLSNAEGLGRLAGAVRDGLHEAEDSVLSKLGALAPLMAQAAALDPDLKPYADQLSAPRFQLEDLHRSLASYCDKLEGDPVRLDEVNLRLADLEKIKRRFGGSVEAALRILAEGVAELEGLQGSEERLADLQQRIGEVAKGLHSTAEQLSARRREAAESFDREILGHMGALGMEKAVFETRVEPLKARDGTIPMYSATGMDKVEFLLSTNPGQMPRPFSKIASGGELSRTMLALKTVLADGDPTPTLIFDEVDAGISGATAERVGAKLRALGERRQVLCITHLPQIAALSGHHVLVSKAVEGDGTFTRIAALNGEDKVREVARLLSGIDVTSRSVASAEEMVNRGRAATE